MRTRPHARLLLIGSLACFGCGPRISAQLPADPEPTPASSSPAPAVLIEAEGPAPGAVEPIVSGETSDAAEAIARLEETGATSEWDDAVKPILLAYFDSDRSASLQTAGEIARIPCPVYRALDKAVLEQIGTSITLIYGFDYDYLWVGDVLGFDLTQRETIAKAMLACGLPFDTPP